MARPTARQKSLWQRVKSVFAFVEEDATPINYSMAIQTFIVMVASSFILTFIIPFLPEMVLSFGYRESEKGYYVGYVGSAFFVGRTIGAYFWGWLSDKKGPKIVIVINTSLMAAANIGFGLSLDLQMACLTRFLTGTLSGTVTVTKGVLRDLSDSTNQAFYLSIISIGWAVGLIIGPLISGYLSNPAKKYTALFGGNQFLMRYPYFLAAATTSVILVLSVVMVLLKWDDSYYENRKNMKIKDSNENGSHLHEKLMKSDGDDMDETNCQVLHRSSHEDLTMVIRTRGKSEERTKALPVMTRISRWTLFRLLRMPAFCQSTLLYTLSSVCNVAFDTVFSVWASTDVTLNGLAFNPEEIGRFMSVGSLPLAFLQLYIFPKMERRYGAKTTLNFFCCVNILLVPMIAASRILLPYPTVLWVVMITVHAMNSFSDLCVFSCVALFINNSCPLSVIGSANGVAMTVSAVARGMTPTIFGSMFAWSLSSGGGIGFPFDVNFTFASIGMLYYMINCFSIRLPPAINICEESIS